MQFSGGERQRRERLLQKIAEAAHSGVDYVQLREKDLPSRDLETLAREVMKKIRASGGKTRLLINSRPDIALAAGADGVHLRSKDVLPEDVRRIWRAANRPAQPIVAISCHTAAEVEGVEKSGANFVVFGPAFGKKDPPEMGAAGLDLLRTVCQRRIAVFALGGVSAENGAKCEDAGANGIAGIRLFQENNVAVVVAKLRAQR
jgi:thiamine-phosphate pyrophosphorylase